MVYDIYEVVYDVYEVIFIEEQKKQKVGESFTKKVMFELGFEEYYDLGKLRLQRNISWWNTIKRQRGLKDVIYHITKNVKYQGEWYG